MTPIALARLLNHAAPIADILSDRRQLWLMGFRTREAISEGLARKATLDDCRQLGEEHGLEEARLCYETRLRSGDEVSLREQAQRRARRLENLVIAGLSEAQLAAYATAAAETFRARMEELTADAKDLVAVGATGFFDSAFESNGFL